MNTITESAIEKFTIELLEKTGYHNIYGPTIIPNGETPERESFEDVLLIERLRKAIGRINPTVPRDCREDTVKQIQRLISPELIANNEAFHRLLTEGIKITIQKDGRSRGDLVWLVDFKNLENNDFLVVNQFTVIENNVNNGHDLWVAFTFSPQYLAAIRGEVSSNGSTTQEKIILLLKDKPSLTRRELAQQLKLSEDGTEMSA